MSNFVNYYHILRLLDQDSTHLLPPRSATGAMLHYLSGIKLIRHPIGG